MNQSVWLPSQLRRRWLATLERCTRLGDDAGGALVELALMLAFLGVPLLLGTVYYSVLLIDSIIVSNAAHVGAQYGMMGQAYAADTSYIQTAAQEDASGVGTLTVTPTIFYACSTAIGGTQYSTSGAATTACTGGTNHPLEFIQVVASAAVTPPLAPPGLAKTVTLTSTSIMLVEE